MWEQTKQISCENSLHIDYVQNSKEVVKKAEKTWTVSFYSNLNYLEPLKEAAERRCPHF
jgi:hypothetical protein